MIPSGHLTKGAIFKCRLVTDLSRADIARYAGASGDTNLIHVDESYATAAGHPSVVAHGMLTMGLTGTYLANLLGRRSISRFGGRFVAPVYAGDNLDCAVTLTSVEVTTSGTTVTMKVLTTKADGTAVFVGEVEAVVDGAQAG